MASRFSLHAAGDIESTTQATHQITNPEMTAGRLYLLGFICDKGSNAAVAVPTAAQPGYTWDPIPSSLPAGFGSSGRTRIAMFRCQPTQAQIDATPGSGTVTITTGADTTNRRVAGIIRTDDTVFDDSANNGAGALQQPAEGTVTGSNVGTISETLTNAVTAGNATCGFAGWFTGTTGTLTPGTGFTELLDAATAVGTTANVILMAEGWDDANGQADNVIDATKDSGTNRAGIIGVEVKFEAASGATLFIGDSAVDAVYAGDTIVDRLYAGDTLVYQNS